MLITFADPEYLPISLTASLENCTGLLSAGFQLPESVGDGLALIQWFVITLFQSKEKATDLRAGSAPASWPLHAMLSTSVAAAGTQKLSKRREQSLP